MVKMFQSYQGKLYLSLTGNGKTSSIELTHPQIMDLLPVVTGDGGVNYGFDFWKVGVFDLKAYEIAYGRESVLALSSALAQCKRGDL